MSDIRVNFDLHRDEYYYYPDIVVTCDKRDTDKRFVRYPKLIIEVLSDSTERVDRREKLFAYSNIESLEEYALVPQAPGELSVFRRANNWAAESIAGTEGDIHLQSLNLLIPVTAIYEGV